MYSQAKQRSLRIFLCHASDDKPVVRTLYHRLKADGFSPWLDEEDLLPGQEWQKTIRTAVRSCDVVIVCLTPGSVTKTGYVQREIKFALEIAEEKPEGTLFVVPVRLEEVKLPESLSQWQSADLFRENGYERLTHALSSISADTPDGKLTPAGTGLPYNALTTDEVELLEVLWRTAHIDLNVGLTASDLAKQLDKKENDIEKLLKELGPAGRNLINSGETDLRALLNPQPSRKYQLNYFVLAWPPAAQMVCDLINWSGVPPDRHDYIASVSHTFGWPQDVVRHDILQRAEITGYVAPLPNSYGRITATQRAKEHQAFLGRIAKRSKEWESKDPEGRQLMRSLKTRETRSVVDQIETINAAFDSVSVENKKLTSQIDAYLKGLKDANAERDRLIFWCYFQQGMTANEIANIPSISLSPKGVESTLLRVTRLIRERFLKS